MFFLLIDLQANKKEQAKFTTKLPSSSLDFCLQTLFVDTANGNTT